MRGARPDAPLTAAADDGFRPVPPPAWTRWLPFVYIAFVLLLEAAQQQEWAVSFFLIALPAIAAYAFGPLAVAAFTVLAILLEGCLTAISHHLGETHHVTADIATAVVGILATALAAHRRSQERHLVDANSVAEALMRALLRPVPHQVGNVLAACLYRPSEVGTMVGGDLFDIRATRAGSAPSSATSAAKGSRRSARSQRSWAASAKPRARHTTCRPSPPAWNGAWSARPRKSGTPNCSRPPCSSSTTAWPTG